MIDRDIIFNKEELLNFKFWLKLNREGLAWEEHFNTGIDDLWEIFFQTEISLLQLMGRFDYACTYLKKGPLNSWFNWLREKFISYSFIHKKISIYELSHQTHYSYSEVATILRDYFLDFHPYRNDEISRQFQVGNISSKNIFLSYEIFRGRFPLDESSKTLHEEEMMSSLEVTLYDEWAKFLRKMKKDFHVKSQRTLHDFFKILQIFVEYLLLLTLFIGALFLVKEINLWYENNLIDKIKVFSPENNSPRQTFLRPSSGGILSEKLKFNFEEIEKKEIDEKRILNDILEREGRSGTESDLTLTSWKVLPKDFNTVDLEHSDYEELTERGYRDNKYGKTRVYRILITSSDLQETSNVLKDLLEHYKVAQVDNVSPGTKVPGGMYYNLSVHRVKLKKFIMEVMNIEDSILYESKVHLKKNFRGRHKVFIWVKFI